MLFRKRLPSSENPFFIMKIIDGMFLANVMASQDIEFLKNNKVKLIINCAPNEIKFQGSEEFTIHEFHWHASQGKFIKSINEKNAIQICDHIQNCLKDCNSVVFCSKRGHSRALTVCMLYFIHNFSWTLYKTLQYINCKKSDLEVRASFLKLLVDYEAELRNDPKYSLKDSWEEPHQISWDQQIINNTYLNTRGVIREVESIPQRPIVSRKTKKKVKVLDRFEVIQNPKEKIVRPITNNTIHLQRIRSRLNDFVADENPKGNQVSKVRRLSEKCLTESVKEEEEKGNSISTKNRKRCVTPAGKRKHQVQAVESEKKLLCFGSQRPESRKIAKKAIQESSDIYNLNINVSINAVNFYKEKTRKISSFNRQKLKVYLNPPKKRSLLCQTDKQKRSRSSFSSSHYRADEKHRSLNTKTRHFLSIME